MSTSKTIIIIVDYFGSWPEWFDVFLESCGTNPTISWLIHTDCPVPDCKPPNVHLRYTSRNAYIDFINRKLSICFKPHDNYKLCDLKPFYGDLYYDEIKDFD